MPAPLLVRLHLPRGHRVAGAAGRARWRSRPFRIYQLFIIVFSQCETSQDLIFLLLFFFILHNRGSGAQI